MKFRRSVKSERSETHRPLHASIPQKDAIAIEPPKKVIKALYDWAGNDQNPMYLSFSTGDFLHVVGRENDTEWYEACNPLKNERGLVPVKFFGNVGKTVRNSDDSGNSGGGATHDSGYAEGNSSSSSSGAGRPAAAGQPQLSNGPAAGFMPAHRGSKSVSKTAAGVYGIVSFDFHAERPDELDAKEGEAIIVIAQSNPEWFVAKPITRLGGPGLIPVSFVELRDMTTGKPVEDALEAVQRAGIPKVEEWKKMAAEYKNTSIPLGTVSSSQQVHDLQQNLERLSMNNGQQNGHARQGSGVYGQPQQNPFAPVRASVPRYVYQDNKYHFVVEAKLSNGSHWDLSRIYEDFYQLQISLISAFPDEAGQTPGRQRILPYMPGPVQIVTDNISEGRRVSLDEYLRDLLRLPEHIISSDLVRSFFGPRRGDYEVDPSAVDLDMHAQSYQAQERNSQVSYHSQQNGVQQQTQQQLYGAQQASGTYNHQRQQASTATAHYRAPSEVTTTQSTQSSAPIQHGGSEQQSRSTTATGSGVKVKVWYDRDTCVVIRMPPRNAFDYEQLYSKIADRRRLEFRGQLDEESYDAPLHIEYRDERTENYYLLEGDADLDVALERSEKLTLGVRMKNSSDDLRSAEHSP